MLIYETSIEYRSKDRVNQSDEAELGPHLAAIDVIEDEEYLMGGGESEVKLDQVRVVEHLDQHRPLT